MVIFNSYFDITRGYCNGQPGGQPAVRYVQSDKTEPEWKDVGSPDTRNAPILEWYIRSIRLMLYNVIYMCVISNGI